MEEKHYRFSGPEDLLAYRLEAISGLLHELYDRHDADPLVRAAIDLTDSYRQLLADLGQALNQNFGPTQVTWTLPGNQSPPPCLPQPVGICSAPSLSYTFYCYRWPVAG